MTDPTSPNNQIRIKNSKKNNFRSLDLSSAHLIEFDPSMLPGEFIFSNLTKLNLGNNRVGEADMNKFFDLLHLFSNLKDLNLSKNGLDGSILPRIYQLPYSDLPIRKLVLSNNFITELSPGISSLQGLQELDLSNNNLTSLADELGQITSLSSLFLRRNQLSSLPGSLSNLCQLKTLTLGSSKFGPGSGLDCVFFGLSNLTNLDLSLCSLSDSDLIFSSGSLWTCFPQMQVLNLAYNSLTVIPDEAITSMPLLTRLLVNDNKIQMIPQTFWKKLSRLESIDLHSNPLILERLRAPLEELDSMKRDSPTPHLPSIFTSTGHSNNMKLHGPKVPKFRLFNIHVSIPDEVVRGLYVSDFYPPFFYAGYLHEELGISHILSMAPDKEVPKECLERFEYKFIDILDLETTDITEHLDPCTQFVHEKIQQGKKVLVHCVAGKSRSISFVMAYLIRFHGLSLMDSYLFVLKNRRCLIQPNAGFLKQLYSFWQSQNSKINQNLLVQ